MTPASSPLETLRQLREMLDAGTLTPAEFEALKQQLVFAASPAAAPETAETLADGPADLAAASAPYAVAAGPAAVLPEAVDATPSTAPTIADTYAEAAAVQAAAAQPANYLNLILAIGGLLGLLGLVLYLSMGRHPSERLDSRSQTATDSTATAIETGPQAAPLPAPAPVVPETVRVAPTNPAPPVPRPSRPAAADSTAARPQADSLNSL